MTDPQKQSNQPQFILQHVYVKDLSLEVPASPHAFHEESQPKINMELTVSPKKISGDSYEVILQITISADSKDKTLFLIEIKQAGLFTIKGFTEEQYHQVTRITCAAILFPYARASVAYLTGCGGFPSLHLAPVNFESLYAQQLEEGEKKPERLEKQVEDSV